MADAREGPDGEALHAALRRLLAPLAKLAVHHGVTHATLDAWLREAFVAEAFDAHPDVPAHRRVSRVSAATGLHRREVQRLLNTRTEAASPPRSLAAEVFAHWLSDPGFRGRHGAPKTLARTGPAPSFESLAHDVTRDVHPRTLLEELLRLKLVRLDTGRDVVELVAEGFVPSQDARQMLGLLSNNVGDHLDAAVANVLGDDAPHFEQALFADGLSPASMAEYKTLVTSQWRALTDTLVPALERLLERDLEQGIAVAAGQGAQRVRLGLYSFNAPSSAAGAPDVEPAVAQRPQRRASKTSRSQAPVKRKAVIKGKP